MNLPKPLRWFLIGFAVFVVYQWIRNDPVGAANSTGETLEGLAWAANQIICFFLSLLDTGHAH